MKKVKGFVTVFLACLMLLGSALAVSAGDGYATCRHCGYRAVTRIGSDSNGQDLYGCGYCGRTGDLYYMVG